MIRFTGLFLTFLATAVVIVVGALVTPAAWWGLLISAPLNAIGVWDLIQTKHSLLRNYPVIGHMRWLFEGIRPEIRQYLIESEDDAIPFSREQRAIVYQRAKGVLDKRPFGTTMDVYANGYAWLAHSASPVLAPDPDFRIVVGGDLCVKPYSSSIYNVSGMSFGALSGNAIEALNRGAKTGGFAHDTGEGGMSSHHRKHGGDLIWQVGSGYFGCRDEHGDFDPEQFRDNATNDQVKMIEIKMSQGAKPGHGGVLPAAKITEEISRARGVPMGRDCVSPSRHSAFSSPIEMMHFIQRLRELSGGKPIGFKLCVGHHWEVLAMVKAMLETGIRPDFIVVDGKEGGTGAAPLEFANHVGTPLVEGLAFVRNALVGSGLRDQIRIGASGKVVTAFDIVYTLSLGADWCNAARGFMFALGCIQAQACHTNRCPVGVTTQDPIRQRALVVGDKSERVRSFHRKTLETLAELIAASGLKHPSEIQPRHIQIRKGDGLVSNISQAYPIVEQGELLHGPRDALLAEQWDMAQTTSFQPVV